MRVWKLDTTAGSKSECLKRVLDQWQGLNAKIPPEVLVRWQPGDTIRCHLDRLATFEVARQVLEGHAADDSLPAKQRQRATELATAIGEYKEQFESVT